MRLENISFSYNGSEKIFDNVNFTLEYGDFVLLSGVSGEGKSTLLSIINGMIPFITPGKLEGKIYVNSEDVTAVRVSERARLIGTVLQNADEQIVYDIVRDEIAFGCENLDIPVETIDRRIEASTNMMKISPDAKTRTMSGGQKQRLITASTLAMKQKIIILDEPLANLDVEGAHVLLGALRSLAKSGYAVLLVEHRLDVVRPYVNKVMWIKDKNVIVSTDKDAVTRSERVIEPENNAHTAGSPVISGRGLVFSAGGRNILDSLDIDVYKGCLLYTSLQSPFFLLLALYFDLKARINLSCLGRQERFLFWLRRQDLNLRLLGYEPNELPTAPLRYIKQQQANRLTIV